MVPPFSAFRFHRFVLFRRTSRVLLSSHTSTFSGQGRGRRLGNMVAMPGEFSKRQNDISMLFLDVTPRRAVCVRTGSWELRSAGQVQAEAGFLGRCSAQLAGLLPGPFVKDFAEIQIAVSGNEDFETSISSHSE
jgi:hypothetical protein